MKDGSRFFTWSIAFANTAMVRAIEVTLGIVLLVLMLLGLLMANLFGFDLAYIPLPAIAIAYLIVRRYIVYLPFCKEQYKIRCQLKYLYRYKKLSKLNDDELTDINAVIQHLESRTIVLVI
jgi:hypothetical protein